MYDLEDTIAAIATPMGLGGISIVRVSGKNAFVISAAFSSCDLLKQPSHTARLGYVLDQDGKALDQALFLVMRSPTSFSGEDTVEIQCHGGGVVAQMVLDRVLESGARLAFPGEFSYRAVVHGKMDLVQAEAVQQIAEASGSLSQKLAIHQLAGDLSVKVVSIQKALLEVIAEVEVCLDFPEETPVESTESDLLQKTLVIEKDLQTLGKTFHQGALIAQGATLCLLGAPNVGKSSIMNALLGYDRNIVSELPGTTRDVVRERLEVGGVGCFLVDTAGIREGKDYIEQEGIRRSRHAMGQADFFLFVFDQSRPPTEEELALAKEVSLTRTLFIWNKKDLAPTFPETGVLYQQMISISAHSEQDICLLKEVIGQMVLQEEGAGSVEGVLTRKRHKQMVDKACGYVRAALEGFNKGGFAEAIAVELRSALTALQELLGVDVSEEVLTSIFSKFCLGK